MVQARTPHAESGRLGTKQLPASSCQALEAEECGKDMNEKVVAETCKMLRH